MTTPHDALLASLTRNQTLFGDVVDRVKGVMDTVEAEAIGSIRHTSAQIIGRAKDAFDAYETAAIARIPAAAPAAPGAAAPGTAAGGGAPPRTVNPPNQPPLAPGGPGGATAPRTSGVNMTYFWKWLTRASVIAGLVAALWITRDGWLPWFQHQAAVTQETKNGKNGKEKKVEPPPVVRLEPAPKAEPAQPKAEPVQPKAAPTEPNVGAARLAQLRAESPLCAQAGITQHGEAEIRRRLGQGSQAEFRAYVEHCKEWERRRVAAKQPPAKSVQKSPTDPYDYSQVRRIQVPRQK